jgi:hypothetical protein
MFPEREASLLHPKPLDFRGTVFIRLSVAIHAGRRSSTVEQLIRNQQVAGSIPAVGSTFSPSSGIYSGAQRI